MGTVLKYCPGLTLSPNMQTYLQGTSCLPKIHIKPDMYLLFTYRPQIIVQVPLNQKSRNSAHSEGCYTSSFCVLTCSRLWLITENYNVKPFPRLCSLTPVASPWETALHPLSFILIFYSGTQMLFSVITWTSRVSKKLPFSSGWISTPILSISDKLQCCKVVVILQTSL